ncbi:hypothetical protein AQUCO_06400036v1 [Aquilegia coerulea]|uniref:Uncharacterized protein n=1 Tax=Aquilegia coerulea TaxID=218851 RepID=A0A2G5CCH3_AQUCA|nr:hypothetical protein AQUCO_06400036v1 [Aquilegia coerulea]
MVTKLDGHIMRCVRDQNGNHVTQKCIFIHFQLTQLENGNYARLSKEVIERSHQLRYIECLLIVCFQIKCMHLNIDL